MRNKCLLGLGLVFVISLTSMVAFAFSFTGTPADEVDETEMIVRAVVSEKADAMPTMEPITTTGQEQEMVKNEQSKIGSMDWDSDDAYATMSTMCLQAKDGQLNFVGLDGHVLAWDKIDYDGEFELLIPKNTIDKLKTLGLTGEVRIRHSNAMAIFATEDFEICTRLVQGEYYKYQNMFKELPLHTVISRKELLDAMVRAKMCTAEKCPVKFEIAGSQLGLSIKDQTTDYHETVDLQEDISEELTIGFDARLVIETLKAFDCDNVGISLQGPKMPMIVEAEDSDFKTIVLPVAIK